jgi:transposase
MWDILPGTLYHWYRNHISDYLSDRDSGKWPSKSLMEVDQDTGEVLKANPVHVLKPENVGQKMCIDDKAIGRDGFTILSNAQTGKIAMMIESCKGNELSDALSLFGDALQKVKTISCDMSPTYLKLCNEQIPHAQTVVDKFHVMSYLYDAVLDVRSRIKKELTGKLTKGKEKTEKDREILYHMELLRRCRYRLTQSPEKWSDTTKLLMSRIFDQHQDLKTAYDLSQDFKKWYDKSNCFKNDTVIKNDLYKWYGQVNQAGLEEMKSVVKMIRKHQYQILNYFHNGHTNAKAETLNSKIQRFVAANYGYRDKDFALYRIAGYFS